MPRQHHPIQNPAAGPDTAGPARPFAARPWNRPVHPVLRAARCGLLLVLLLAVLSAQPVLAELQQLYYPDRQLKARFNTTVGKKGAVLRHGLFQRFYSDGKLNVQGAYRLDRPVGVWSWWNEDGILVRRVRYDGDFQELLFGKDNNSPNTKFSNPAGRVTAQGLLKHDKGHGQWRYWFDTGQLKAQGKFVTGVPDGRWVTLYADGQIKSIREYRLGILHGKFMLAFPSGQEKVEGRMEQGMKVGLWRYWYASGQQKSEGGYLNDREDGLWRFWNENGEPRGSVLYRVGRVEKVLPMAPKPAAQTLPEAVIPLHDQQKTVNPGVFDEDGRPIQQEFYDAVATPPLKKGR